MFFLCDVSINPCPNFNGDLVARVQILRDIILWYSFETFCGGKNHSKFMFCYSAKVILLCYTNPRCTALPNDDQGESHGISSSWHTLKHIPYTLKYIDSPAVVRLFMACLQDLVIHIICACFIGTDTIYWLSPAAQKSSCAREINLETIDIWKTEDSLYQLTSKYSRA